MTDPVEYTRNELRQAIAATLRSRPNQSCKKETLPDEVCRHLKTPVRRRTRDRLKGAIKKIVNALKRSRILKEYKATNVRIRLVEGHEGHLERICSQPSGKDVAFTTAATQEPTSVGTNPVGQGDDYSQPFQIPELPPLAEPTPTELDDFDGMVGDDEDDTDVEPDEEVDSGLFGVLVGAETPVQPSGTREALGLDFASLCNQVALYANSLESMSCEVVFNRVKLTLRANSVTVNVTVKTNARTQCVDFVTTFVDLRVSPDDVLRLAAQDSFLSIPGLLQGGPQPPLQLRRHLPFCDNMVPAFVAALDQAVSDALSIVDIGAVY